MTPISVEPPDRGEPWVVRRKDGLVIIIVDESLAEVAYPNSRVVQVVAKS